MRIYLAARYTRREELCVYRTELEELGHTVTSRWLHGEHQILDAEMMSMSGDDDIAAKRTQFAVEDFEDLLRSVLCISFTEPPRGKHSRGGRHVEFGIALANNIRCMVAGYRENVFHCLPGLEFFESWEACRELIRTQRACDTCACTEERACQTGFEMCSWAGPRLCSACAAGSVDREELVAAQHGLVLP